MKLLGLDTNKIKTFVDKKNYKYLYIYYFLLVGVNFLEIIGISSIPFFILSLTENNISEYYFQFLNLNSLLSKINMRLEIFFGLLIFVIFLIKNMYIIFLSY